jgi:hypothetical protein
MTGVFTIGHKYSIGIVPMALAILLLPPSSFGSDKARLIEQAFGQFNFPSSPEGGSATTSPSEQSTTTTPSSSAQPSAGTANGLTFLERGLVGSTLSTQNRGDAANANNYVANGRFRLYVNQSLLQRFIAEMTLAPIDGSVLNNVTIEESAPHRFEITPNGTSTVTPTSTGSIPPFSSRIVARISVNTIPAIDNVPMTISTTGQVLAVQGISINESRITDTAARDVLSIIDGQTIYGTISR